MGTGNQAKAYVVKVVLDKNHLKAAKILPSQIGYRNRSFPVLLTDGRWLNIILYKDEPGILARIKYAHQVSNYLAKQGFPVRKPADNRIMRLHTTAAVRYAAIYDYLPGDTIPWEAYTMDHLKLLGKTMAQMHAVLQNCKLSQLPDTADEYLSLSQTISTYFSDRGVVAAAARKLGFNLAAGSISRLEDGLKICRQLPGKHALHMDFVRGNILFQNVRDQQNDPGEQAHRFGLHGILISGILDFEKCSFGVPLFEVARTLAFLLVDCKYKSNDKVEKYFLQSGYIKRGHQPLSNPTLPSNETLLDTLVNLFLVHDLYKFMKHNPYESLHENEHFIRTRDLLMRRSFIEKVENAKINIKT